MPNATLHAKCTVLPQPGIPAVSLSQHAEELGRAGTVGASTTAKVGFHGATSTVQRANANQVAVTLGNADGEIDGLTISDPPTQAEVQALRDACEEFADDVRALSTLVHALRTALVNAGLIKGEA